MHEINKNVLDHNCIIWAALNVQYDFFFSPQSSSLLCVQKNNGKREVSNNVD